MFYPNSYLSLGDWVCRPANHKGNNLWGIPFLSKSNVIRPTADLLEEVRVKYKVSLHLLTNRFREIATSYRQTTVLLPAKTGHRAMTGVDFKI
ncbi:hypothetical protein [Fodinibius halophilus]|uniref:hypothetical protein n=1 Tax=Fodinibius halophilus TaxID=1736908 RepID=UPI0013E9F139|nr:hypothetical protein [Fodinibius halophilus]